MDTLVAGSVEEGPRATPPTTPALGAAYIVGPSPTRAWAGKSQSVAAFTSGGWRFVAPVEGMSLYVKAGESWATYRLGVWEIGTLRGSSVVLGGQQVVGGRTAAIVSATGGTTIDVQARAVLDQILAALRQHGLIET